MFRFLALLVTFSVIYAQEPEPYDFTYSAETGDGSLSTRSESGDREGRVTGFYTLSGPDGRIRRVDYVADENGFRASVTSNENGVQSSYPASATIESSYDSTTLENALKAERGSADVRLDSLVVKNAGGSYVHQVTRGSYGAGGADSGAGSAYRGASGFRPGAGGAVRVGQGYKATGVGAAGGAGVAGYETGVGGEAGYGPAGVGVAGGAGVAGYETGVGGVGGIGAAGYGVPRVGGVGGAKATGYSTGVGARGAGASSYGFRTGVSGAGVAGYGVGSFRGSSESELADKANAGAAGESGYVSGGGVRTTYTTYTTYGTGAEAGQGSGYAIRNGGRNTYTTYGTGGAGVGSGTVSESYYGTQTNGNNYNQLSSTRGYRRGAASGGPGGRTQFVTTVIDESSNSLQGGVGKLVYVTLTESNEKNLVGGFDTQMVLSQTGAIFHTSNERTLVKYQGNEYYLVSLENPLTYQDLGLNESYLDSTYYYVLIPVEALSTSFHVLKGVYLLTFQEYEQYFRT